MKTFAYKGFDPAGRSSKGLIEALDPKEAREKLASRGILAESVSAAGEAQTRGARLSRGSFALDIRAMIYRELGALVKAGLPLAQAMEVLIEAPELGDNRARLAGVRDRIREGANLAAALADASPKVSAFERAVIEVGERSGTLEVVLERLAGYLEEQSRVRDRVQTAVIYPAIVFSMAVVIGILMLGVMIPRVANLLAETNMPLPVITRVVMVFGRWVLPVSGVLLLAAAGFVFLLRHRSATDPGLRARLDRRLFGIPLLGTGYLALVNLRFARTLALLLGGGVPLVDGVSLAGRATGSPWVSAMADDAAIAVRHGKSLADAVRAIQPLSTSLPGWIQAGEASGKLAELLENAGTRFQQQWDRLVSRTLTILEPALILVVGGFVLVVALSILLPILSLNQTVM